jgi:hypothetical protein
VVGSRVAPASNTARGPKRLKADMLLSRDGSGATLRRLPPG